MMMHMSWVDMVSAFLIALGQTVAMVAFLSENHPLRAMKRRPIRFLIAFFFLLLNGGLQAALRMVISVSYTGEAPMLLYVLASMAIYILFVFLWGELPPDMSVFVGLIFLVADNCVWPLLSSVSSLMWGVNYLYSGSLLIRLPAIALLWALEYGFLGLIHHYLPSLTSIRITGYMRVMIISSIIPFLYIRVLSGQMTVQDNKGLQIAMTICFLVQMLTLVRGVGAANSEQERINSLRMRSVLEMQHQQFAQKLRNIDEVNRKYHDMKNFLLYLESGREMPKDPAAIRRIVEDIKPFEAAVSTGNEAIDIILSEKLKLCDEKGICCVPYVDGKTLDFVDPLDLCTLFGNALDNAIESCQQIEQKESRHIGIKLVSKGTAVVLVFRNTYAKAPHLRDGMPVSTKEDKENHGFGLKNIGYVMEKYHGQMRCSVEKDEFVLTLLFLR